MKNKRGIIGSFAVNFVATIIIIIMLLVFAFTYSALRSYIKAEEGLVVYTEEKLGIEDGVGYMENYAKLVEARSKIDEDTNLDEALLEVGYEK